MFKDRETIQRPIDIQTFENIGVASNVTTLRRIDVGQSC